MVDTVITNHEYFARIVSALHCITAYLSSAMEDQVEHLYGHQATAYVIASFARGAICSVTSRAIKQRRLYPGPLPFSIASLNETIYFFCRGEGES
jgi:hypothetical protein